ncbi:MAG TPA: uroporphyrinogen decarboxylase family protein [bacterium]|nr:uroporphyrinogen decarboxylase family protein [bacterium]
MNSKQRVLASLEHRQPDRVPVDFGTTGTTSLHVTCVAALRDYYGLEKRPVKVHEPHQMLGWMDEDLKRAIGVDVDAPFPSGTIFGFRNEDWKPWRWWNGLEVLVPGKFNTIPNESGGIYQYPQGDLAAPPSGHMPKDGFYFDAVIRQEPVQEDALDPIDNLEEYGLISEREVQETAAAIAEAASHGRAVIAKFSGTSFGDIARVPGLNLKRPKGIRDITEWYVSIASRPDYIHAVFSKQLEYALHNLEKLHAAIGDRQDVIFVCGTDFGTQTSTFCSVQTYKNLFLPYYKAINGWIHANTPWKTFKHSCGAVEKFMDAFIESGFDIINPVQCSAAGMDPQHLKKTYGGRLVFWGGGVDTQQVLPFGTPEEVREQVLRRCEIFAPGGGFVFNTVHNIQANTPVENIVAMFEAVKEFNGR